MDNNSQVVKIIKEDKLDINNKEEMANSMNECKLHDQTLKLIKGRNRNFTSSNKNKSKSAQL